MSRIIAVIAVFAIGVFVTEKAIVAQDSSQKLFDKIVFSLQPNNRFDGTIKLQTADGDLRSLHVTIQKWSLVGSGGESQASRFPNRGLMIVQLVAGHVVTIINGEKKERIDGEFWTVPTDSFMSIQILGEMASLQTMTVNEE